MADKDLGDGDGPSLEMPSLGSLFKRKKKPAEKDDAPTVSREELDEVVRGKKPSRDPEPEASAVSDRPAPTEAVPDDAAAEPDAVRPKPSADAVTAKPSPDAVTPKPSPDAVTPKPSPDDSADTSATDEPTVPTDASSATPGPATGTTDETPTAVVPRVGEEADAEHTTVLPEVEDDAAAASTDPVASSRKTAPADDPAPADGPAASASDESTPAEPGAEDDDERPLFADEVDKDEADTDEAADTTSGETAVEGPGAESDDDTDTDVDAEEDEDNDAVARAPRERRSFTLPPLPGRAAAAVTGLVVGFLAVAMTYLAVQGCEKVKGTSSCGTPGFFLLIAIMILLVVLGSSLLNAWQLADPGSTSFMAVGLVAVVALLFLIRVIFSPWMVVVIPLVAIVAFVVSHWLTSLFVDEDSPLDESVDAPA